jgi:predicted MPP superfamily phosphohydrolase
MLAYGAVVEANRLVLEQHSLRLPLWPQSMDGYRVAVLGDFHLRDKYSVALARRAAEMAVACEPDALAIVGDFIGRWKPSSIEMLVGALEPLRALAGRALAVPGNHDYPEAGVEILKRVLDELGIRLLRNEAVVAQGVRWVGLDSARRGMSSPGSMIGDGGTEPSIALWHEPDLVDELPPGCALQISGHSHGGQFRLPFGITPMHSKYGRKYVRGFFPGTPTPLYVTRGVGTTGPPSRFLCPPEVSLLTLRAE